MRFPTSTVVPFGSGSRTTGQGRRTTRPQVIRKPAVVAEATARGIRWGGIPHRAAFRGGSVRHRTAPANPRPRLRASGSRGRNGAGDGLRTRDIQLGKLTLYQLSYTRPAGVPRDLLRRTGGKRLRATPRAAQGAPGGWPHARGRAAAGDASRPAPAVPQPARKKVDPGAGAHVGASSVVVATVRRVSRARVAIGTRNAALTLGVFPCRHQASGARPTPGGPEDARRSEEQRT